MGLVRLVFVFESKNWLKSLLMVGDVVVFLVAWMIVVLGWFLVYWFWWIMVLMLWVMVVVGLWI